MNNQISDMEIVRQIIITWGYIIWVEQGDSTGMELTSDFFEQDHH